MSIDERVDRGAKRVPAHLDSGPTPGYFTPSDKGLWWGWHHIAWPLSDDWVPENTYWRRDPNCYTADPTDWTRCFVWEDAT